MFIRKHNLSVTGLKSMFPMLQKTKTQNTRVWSKEKFIPLESHSKRGVLAIP